MPPLCVPVLMLAVNAAAVSSHACPADTPEAARPRRCCHFPNCSRGEVFTANQCTDAGCCFSQPSQPHSSAGAGAVVRARCWEPAGTSPAQLVTAAAQRGHGPKGDVVSFCLTPKIGSTNMKVYLRWAALPLPLLCNNVSSKRTAPGYAQARCSNAGLGVACSDSPPAQSSTGARCVWTQHANKHSRQYAMAGAPSLRHSLTAAKAACLKHSACNAVTCDAGSALRCSLRASTELNTSPAGDITYTATCGARGATAAPPANSSLCNIGMYHTGNLSGLAFSAVSGA